MARYCNAGSTFHGLNLHDQLFVRYNSIDGRSTLVFESPFPNDFGDSLSFCSYFLHFVCKHTGTVQQSVDLRASMKRAPMSKELRKAYLAVRPSRMDVGDLFSFRDETLPTWFDFDIVIDNTITILLL